MSLPDLDSCSLLCSIKRRVVKRVFENLNQKKNLQPSLARPSDLETRVSQKSLKKMGSWGRKEYFVVTFNDIFRVL